MTTAPATVQPVSAAPTASFHLDLDDHDRGLKLDRQAASVEQSFSFDPYHLIPHRRLLLKAGQPVRLGSRAMDVLIALVERAGEDVSKDELIARVWPKMFVEEANLRVHVAAVRKALGETDIGSRYLITIPGRGYRFVAPIRRPDAKRPLAMRVETCLPARPLPNREKLPIGSNQKINELARRVMDCRLVTLVGPPGIGKTAIATAVSQRLLGLFEQQVRFIALADMTDSRSLVAAVASALEIESHDDNAMPALIDAIRARRILLVLDSCDRILEAAATLVESLMKHAPHVRVLATSREPLCAASEVVHRLSPLPTPPKTSDLTAAEALEFPAVELFVDRAATTLGGYELTDCDAPVVADICRRLDGIPLAIELAAYSVYTFGLRDLASMIDGRFRLSMRGRRTTERRHRTLLDALEWSYGALPPFEQDLLRRFAIFPDGFTFEGASAIAVDNDISSCDVACGIANLVSKSLLTANVSGSEVEYRLLNTTRIFAWQKLAESHEFENVARRHNQRQDEFMTPDGLSAARMSGRQAFGCSPSL